jgi:integrase
MSVHIYYRNRYRKQDCAVGQKVREVPIDRRDARRRLPARKEPYWRLMSEGEHIGYYRGSRLGKWVARTRQVGTTGGYLKVTLGEADDQEEADGERWLNFKQAQEKARAWFAEIGRRGFRAAGPYTVSKALDDYLAAFRGKSAAKTKARVESAIRPELGNIEVVKLTKRRIEQWLADRAKSPARLRTSKRAQEPNERPADTPEALRRRRSTANRDLTVLKAALNHAFRDREDIPSDDAWRRVKPYEGADQAKLRYLSDEEARRLVNACDAAFRPMVQAALLTGARYGELASIEVRDVDLAAKTVWLRETKAGKPRVCYLEDEGAELFKVAIAGKRGNALVFPRPDGGRWTSSQQARPLATACENGKVSPPATFHDLRRTYGARMALRGVPMAVIAEAMGHADERITKRHYAHLSPSHVADTVRAALAGMGVVSTSNVVRMERKSAPAGGRKKSSSG